MFCSFVVGRILGFEGVRGVGVLNLGMREGWGCCFLGGYWGFGGIYFFGSGEFLFRLCLGIFVIFRM